MGNSQSNEISDEYSKYIEEQKQIIESQQNQINRLERLSRVGTSVENNIKKKPSKLDEGNKKKMTTKEKLIFILKIFELTEEYDEVSLKKAYLKLAMTHHPDKGGDPQKFNKITQAYQFLLRRLSQKDSNKSHHELKNENTDFVTNQMSDNRQNVNLSKKFDSTVFNKIYEEHRVEDVYDPGYDKWINENKFSSDKIEKTNIGKGNFHRVFQEQKKKQVRKDVIPYGEPQVSISYKGKDSLSILGNSKVDDFSGECDSGLQYRDYKDAFSNTLLIDEGSVDISKRSKTIRQANSERKNISYEASEEDLEKQKYILAMEEKKEKERIKRLEKSDNKAFDTYNAIHQRMLGR
tara:strand:+ start:1162 stop:2211 length:1050 start_codon:yes stop_codon:yes gene_type:complete